METGATIVMALIVIGCIGLCAKSILKCIKCKKMRRCYKKEEESKKKKMNLNLLDLTLNSS